MEVFLEKDPISKTNGIRLQAMENKEAMSKALIKSGAGGSETEFGMMLMELKLEDHEFYGTSAFKFRNFYKFYCLLDNAFLCKDANFQITFWNYS